MNVLEMIAEVGVPIGVMAYLFWDKATTQKENTNILRELVSKIEKALARIEQSPPTAPAV